MKLFLWNNERPFSSLALGAWRGAALASVHMEN